MIRIFDFIGVFINEAQNELFASFDIKSEVR